MSGVNKVFLIGRLGSDPEIRYTTSGAPVANFRIATSESWTGKDGKKEERTEWHKIVAWGKLGELCGEYLNKGRRVFVEGRLQTRNYDDKDGVKKYITEIVALNVQFLDSPQKRSEEAVSNDTPPDAVDAPAGRETAPPDDIPF